MQCFLIGILCFVPAVWANLPTTTVWEIRPSVGADTNGGCFDSAKAGTDFSQQNSAQFSATDLVLVTGNTITSASHSFTSTDVGNCINISVGTGFTTGFYEIVSVLAGTATLDRNAGTAPLTGGTWAEGGALVSPATAIVAAENGVGGTGNWPAGQTFWLKSTGAFTQTAGTIDIQGGNDPQGPYPLSLNGYSTTRGDNGIFSWTTSSSADLLGFGFNNGSNFLAQNIAFSSTAASPGSAIGTQGSAAILHHYKNDSFTGFSFALNMNESGNTTTSLLIDSCETSGGGTGIQIGGSSGSIVVLNSFIHGGSGSGIVINSGTISASIVNTVIYSMSSDGIRNNVGSVGQGAVVITLIGVDLVSNGGNGYKQAGNEQSFFSAQNSLFISNGGYGISTQITSPAPISASRNNGFYNNSSGSYFGYVAAVGDITLTGNPFVSMGTNFALNNTSGAGAAARGAGFPGVTSFPTGATMGTGFIDIGALQHQAGGGNATIGTPIIQ